MRLTPQINSCLSSCVRLKINFNNFSNVQNADYGRTIDNIGSKTTIFQKSCYAIVQGLFSGLRIYQYIYTPLLCSSAFISTSILKQKTKKLYPAYCIETRGTLKLTNLENGRSGRNICPHERVTIITNAKSLC